MHSPELYHKHIQELLQQYTTRKTPILYPIKHKKNTWRTHLQKLSKECLIISTIRPSQTSVKISFHSVRVGFKPFLLQHYLQHVINCYYQWHKLHILQHMSFIYQNPQIQGMPHRIPIFHIHTPIYYLLSAYNSPNYPRNATS